MSVNDLEELNAAVESLINQEAFLGTVERLSGLIDHSREPFVVERYYFVKGEPRTHHLHMVELSSDFWKSHLLFRDYLRRHREVAEEYERLKVDLAIKHERDREAYTEGKSLFIEEVLKKAGG